MENRRKNPRFKLHQMIEIAYFKETFIQVLSVDISAEGIQCIVKEPVELHSQIFIMFEIPKDVDAHIIRCNGIVMWEEEEDDAYHIGICFDSLSDNDKALLQKYLDSME